MRTNTHGLTMRGLKAAAGKSHPLWANGPKDYLRIAYNQTTGAVISDYYCACFYLPPTPTPPGAVHVADLKNPETMQQIADRIAESVAIAHAQPDSSAPTSLLRVARIKSGMTQTQAADALKLPQSQIAAWETGARNPKLQSLRKLSEIYHCPISDIIS